MAKRLFDRKLGERVWDALPAQPGVYRFWDAAGSLIYVGKAKNLRRRVGQYRRARRIKVHQKMREILREAARFDFDVCATEHAALELELHTIQSARPRFNVSGAYSHLYPYVVWQKVVPTVDDGLNPSSTVGTTFVIGITFDPEKIPFQGFGAFRSRLWTREVLEALERLLEYVAHPDAPPLPHKQMPRWTRLRAFRGLPDPEEWYREGAEYFRTGDPAFIERLALELLDRVAARRDAALVQERLRVLRRFATREIKPLARAVENARCAYPVAQRDRDFLFLGSYSGGHNESQIQAP